MHARLSIREPLVVTFDVPTGLATREAQRLIDRWYGALEAYDFVYLGGTSFALNPPCPRREVLAAALSARIGAEVEVQPLRVLLNATAGAPAAV